MKFTIQLNSIETIDQIAGYWSKDDYRNLLELFDFGDSKNLPDAELWEMLKMAVSDFEPEDAAEVVLTYKLGNLLKDGQIKNISNEMLEDKIAEEYSDISFHYPLFNINQLLYKLYNGKFPKSLASKIHISLSFEGQVTVNKEIVLRTISDLLSEKSVLKGLFNEQLDSENELKDAKSIIWELMPLENNTFQVISSDYWFNNEDFVKDEHSGTLREEEINHGK